MATIVEKVQALETGITSVKEDFKTALENKGVEVAENLKLKEYPPLIENIKTGGGEEGGASYYKCVAVNVNNKTWKGVKATIDNSGNYVFEDEEVTLNYNVRPEVGYIYNQSGKIYVSELNRNLGFDIYCRRREMGGYNLEFIDEVDHTSYSNAGYFFRKVKNKRFKDYIVPGDYGSYALAISYDGNLYSWGSYSWGDCISGIGGALSNPNPNKSTYYPRLADASGNWERLFCIYQNTWVMNDKKELYRCGRNEYGELGFGNSRAYWKLTKLEVDGITSWKKVALYNNTGRTYVLSEDGRLFVSGNGQSYGELGLGTDKTSVNTFTEIKVSGVTSWKDVFSGYYNAGAISNDGRLFVWGRNHYGQLAQGEGNSDNKYSPIQIGTDKTWIMASFGDDRIIALATDGTLWGSGLANDGRLGLGSFYGTKYELTQIGSRTDWIYVYCKGYHNLMINKDRKVYYCGYDSAQFGGGRSGSESVPTYHGYSIGDYQRCDFERILTNDWNDSDVALISYCNSSSGSFTIPDDVFSLSAKPFESNAYGSYSTIYIPKSVLTISSDAFSNLYSTNIIFEAEQSEIPSGYPWGHSGGDNYFSYGATFEHTPHNQTLEYLMADTFPEDYALVIPDGVSSVYYKFQKYESITSVKIPDTVTSLESAFSGCQNLHTVYIGDISNDSYFMSPFYNCPKLTKIYCDWYRGEKPNVESNTQYWGASNATFIYNHPKRLDIKLISVEGDVVGKDGVDITTLEGEYQAIGAYADSGGPIYKKSELGASGWCLMPPGTISSASYSDWTFKIFSAPVGGTKLLYTGKEDGSHPGWPLGECNWRAYLGSDREASTAVITITVLDNQEGSEEPELTNVDDEPTLESVVL